MISPLQYEMFYIQIIARALLGKGFQLNQAPYIVHIYSWLDIFVFKTSFYYDKYHILINIPF
jgi:hypothetical protein